ncbi:hypothetical protein JZ751_013644 [Albula glossodonta]|uniref:MADF domain-containing protein n=1 Tax=Albula glossodonta TaxID=121402 RepID=A0A8T2P1F4_9TELE|nr:hypothetical protein JZ751_013644 [Albula glossodonta]
MDQSDGVHQPMGYSESAALRYLAWLVDDVLDSGLAGPCGWPQDVEELLKKMKNLRSQYARERRKTRFSAVDNCQVSSSKWYLLSVLKFLEKSEVSISVAEDVSEEVTNDRLKAGAKEEADLLNWPKNGHMGGAIAEKRARLETEEPGSPRGQTTEDAFDIFGKFVASEIRQMESAHMQKVAKLRIQQVLLDVQMDVVAQASSSSQKHSQQ